MRIGIIADTHDNIPKIKKALAAFRMRNCEAIIHAGDVVAPFAAKALRAAKLPIYAVYGNNDGEHAGLADLIEGICDGPRLVELDGRRILVAHSTADVSEEHKTGVDLVVVGHTHIAEIQRTKPLVVNPGEAGGWLYGRPTVAVVDLRELKVEIRPLDG